MGDRANVYVKNEGGGGVFLYSHWGGEELPLIVQKALQKKMRWDDGPYLTRVIFCEMVKGCEEGETGFGISTYPPDNEHAYIVIDPEELTIGFQKTVAVDEKPYMKWPIGTFVTLPREAILSTYLQ